MKKIILSFAIAIVFSAVGCSSTHVSKIYPPTVHYNLAQEPQKIDYSNSGRTFRRNAELENRDRLEYQRRQKLIELMAAERAFAETNGFQLVPAQTPPPPPPTAHPQSRGSRYNSSLRGGWGTYPDQSFRGQIGLLGTGFLAFFFPHSRAGRERGVLTSYSSTSTATRFAISARASGKVTTGQPRLTEQAVKHARSQNQHFDRDRRRGFVEKGSSTTGAVIGAGQFQSAGTPSQPRLR